MAKTHDLKRRIRSIKNTMQVTKAMKMVSAARLRRAQERILATRPFTQAMVKVLSSLAVRANAERHPLLEQREIRRTQLIVVTSDRGLCGSFNANAIKAAGAFFASRAGEPIILMTVGRRGRDFARRRRVPITAEWLDVFRSLEFGTAQQIADDVIERFVKRDVDAVYIVFNEFKSVVSQKPVVEQILPIPRAELVASDVAEDYIYEPAPEPLLDAILPGYVRLRVWGALLESAAAEHAARMTAMDAATKNATDLTEALTLHMNRVRQASITTEIIEVVSGAAALG
ncbi:MAG TPA: ATP synthase F1 subunit gamma [Candidatus Polarisedimenticolaceae bacterium]|nr:ATP synthase F1 subunit gamma [Candidatus Polarisedimenticolaceae bacterium]